MSYRFLPLWCFCLALCLAGCTQGQRKAAPAEPPALPCSLPVERMVTDFADFTGRTDAVEAVDIRARVTGYLTKTAFKEGAEVKEGDLLFEIDRRPYEAQLDQATAQINLSDAQIKYASTTYERDRRLVVSSAISQQELDQARAAMEEARSRSAAYRASTKVYKLNLDFTKVKSPITGQVSRFYLTRGNLVIQDQTLLTTVVKLHPMNVYFDMDEPTLLRIRKAVNDGRIQLPADGVFTVYMALQGEEGYPHKGKIDFINNQVNPTTGSISVRGVFPNPKLNQGVRLLAPGMFVRVHMPIGQPHPGLLVIDRAVGSDQGIKFVYVVDAQNKVEQRRVTTGPLQQDGLRVILSGLSASELVVVGGLQQVQTKGEIRPERIPMPSLAKPALEAEK